MIKENKQVWLDALRSKRYTQTRKAFKRQGPVCDTFCAIGVLLNELDSEGWSTEVNSSGRIDHNIIRNTFSLFDSEGLGNLRHKIIGMNDSLGKSFEEIADYIEANL